MNVALIYPMAAMVALTAFVLLYMFRTRVNAVRNKHVRFAYFKTFSDGEPSEAVLKTGRHFSNLFEAPVLFYAACIVGMILPMPGVGFLICAWLYFFARVIHAWIHIGPNPIRPRIAIYALSWVILSLMWIQIVIEAATRHA